VSDDIDRTDEVLEEWYAAEENGDLLAEMFNGAWLDTQQFPPLEYAVPGIIPEGFGLLVAPPKAGKSWLMCCIALACALGGLALGRIHVDRRPVLYLALEDGQRRLQSRCRHIMSSQPLPAGIHYITKARPAEIIPIICEFLQRHSGEKPLIILDTLGKARPPRPAGADLYAWDYAIGGQLKDTIDTAPGATLLVVHHTRKAESSDFVDAVSGSQGVAGSADFILVLARKRHENEAVLSVTGRDVPEAEYALTVDGGVWQLDGSTLADAAKTAEQRRDQQHLGDRTLEVLAFVNERDVYTKAADLEVCGIATEQARVYLNRLANSGRINKVGRGMYKSVTSVTSVTFPDLLAADVTPVTSPSEPCYVPGNASTSGNTHNVTDVTDVTLPYTGDVVAPGAPTNRTPGYTDRVHAALANARQRPPSDPQEGTPAMTAPPVLDEANR
jgi:AAA domain